MPKDAEAERQSVAELVSLLLFERLKRRAENNYSKENENHIKRIISHVLLWKHSEAEGDKYKDCLYWSVGALRSREFYGKVITSKTISGGAALRHEHLF